MSASTEPREVPSMTRVMVVSFTGDSGLTDYSVSLCRSLSHSVSVELVTSTSFSDESYRPTYPVSKIFRRTRHYPIDIWRFIWHVVVRRPHVLLFQSWLKYPLLELPLVLLFRLLGIRVALTVHDLLPHYPKPWSRQILVRYYEAFDRLIVHSRRQLTDLRAMGVSRPTLVVPHGVYDIFRTRDITKAEARAELGGLRDDSFVVLFFGHLDERKGLVEFLQAAEALADDSRFQFVVAGKPDGRQSVAAALERARASACAVLHSQTIPHEQVQIFFAAADVVALPYLEGTTSGVMKLAMAFRRPVICTDVGDFQESLESWSGIAVARKDLPHSLVQGVQAAVQRSATLNALTEAMSEDMQWSVIGQKYFTHLTSSGLPNAQSLQ